MKASIIIRTYNEARHLPALLAAIKAQEGREYEIILVDSGSSDGTLEIAARQGAKVVFISRDEFSFGRSLNMGCREAKGELLVFVSGHCIPKANTWLRHLTEPLVDGRAVYVYGKQRGGGNTKYSEHQLFRKYFPELSSVPQDGFFINNANASVLRSTWEKSGFDETVTGLEDMELARRLQQQGLRLGYVAEAEVAHLHDETWKQVRWRYEREALALQRIMPQVHLSVSDAIRYFGVGVFQDCGTALNDKRLAQEFGGIVLFRLAQYWGAYRGNKLHRKLSNKQKEHYFYPR